MNREQIESFEKLHNQLFGMYEEISLLSKKNPNDAINKFKLKYINKLLIDSNFFFMENINPLRILTTLKKMISLKMVMLFLLFHNI
jgi:hypothetical protein